MRTGISMSCRAVSNEGVLYSPKPNRMDKKQMMELHKKWYLKLFFHVMSKTCGGIAKNVMFKYLENESAYQLKITTIQPLDDLEIELFEAFHENMHIQRIKTSETAPDREFQVLELIIQAIDHSEHNLALVNFSHEEILEYWSKEFSAQINSNDKSVENVNDSFLGFETIGCAKIYRDLLFYLIHDFEKCVLSYKMNVEAILLQAYRKPADTRSITEMTTHYENHFGDLFHFHIDWPSSDDLEEDVIDPDHREPVFFITQKNVD